MPEPGGNGRVLTNLSVPGHDGTPLATDVFLPGGGRVPVVVTRTPHGRSGHLHEGLGWRRHGFAYVVQDVRGRYDSAGTWSAYRNERGDGAALAAWLAGQPWCDGRVIASGGSYAAYTAWALATAAPSLVTAVISAVPAMGMDRVKFDPSGILRLAEHANWWLERADSRTSRDGLVAAMYAEEPDILRHLPVRNLAGRLWADLPHWTDTLDTGSVPGPEAVGDDELASLEVASLHIGGWYDLLVAETLHHWETVGADSNPRPPTTIVIGPWDHDLVWASTAAVAARGHHPRSRLDLGRLQVDWISNVLDHNPGGPIPTSSVFVTGSEAWIEASRWPPTEVAATTWCTTCLGGLTPPGGAPHHGQVGFRYDPTDPMPSRDPGADRAALDARHDAARFTTEPLQHPLTIIGTPQVQLAATTTAPSTDWIFRLNERTVDGKVYALSQGSLIHRSGPMDVRLTPLAATLPPGSRLELEITSSDFPYLARNLNTGGDRHTSTRTATASQTIEAGAHPATVLLLPTVPPA